MSDPPPAATHVGVLADLKQYVGQVLGVTPWQPVTQAQIDGFAAATGDYQWIHQAAGTPPPGEAFPLPFTPPVAHGFLTLSLVSSMCQAAFRAADVRMAVNYGLDRVRFPAAVQAGQRIRGQVRLSAYTPHPTGAQLTLHVRVDREHEDRPACVATFLVRCYTQAPDRPMASSDSAEADAPLVRYVQDGAVARITLNRPARYNSVNPDLNAALIEALGRARDDAAIRAVVVHGAGPGFCAGADLDVFQGLTPEAGRHYLADVYPGLMAAFTTLPKPIIGAIHGSAAGVGAALALACDLRVMADTASIRYAFINIGLGPDGGASWFLTRLVGYARAFEIAVSGEKVNAERCLALGLTNRVVPGEELMDTAMTWAHQLAEQPTLAVGITKADLQHGTLHPLPETIVFEADQQRAAFASNDLKEGVAAFLQKRTPRFTGT